MELRKEKNLSNKKTFFQKYLFLITMISSIFVSGTIGFAAGQIAINNSIGDSTEISTMKKRVNEAKNNSLKVIEAELPNIISDLEKYDQDINLIIENVNWLNKNFVPVRDVIGRDTIGKFDSLITAVKGISKLVDIPILGNVSNMLNLAQMQLNEIDSLLFGLEKLTVIQQEMSNSHQNINTLFEKYQKEKNIELLFKIEKELNSDLIYQIEDIRNSSIEVNKVFELSSSVLTTVNTTKSIYNSIQKMGKGTLEAFQFWKENKGDSEIGANINESIEKDLAASTEKIQKLPDKLAQRSKSSITSISNVQKEIQTLRVAQMISGE